MWLALMLLIFSPLNPRCITSFRSWIDKNLFWCMTKVGGQMRRYTTRVEWNIYSQFYFINYVNVNCAVLRCVCLKKKLFLPRIILECHVNLLRLKWFYLTHDFFILKILLLGLFMNDVMLLLLKGFLPHPHHTYSR